MGNIFALGGLFGSLGMLFRLLLMMTGQLKGPVLGYFERYGESEGYFFPVPGLLFWAGTVILFTGFALERFVRVDFPSVLLAVLFWAMAWMAFNAKEWVADWVQRLPKLPRWYAELCETSTRHERRRIAYMWLRLPLRTRLLYNANNNAFRQWTEMVILATL
jgi:hypothetical protein